jgi:phosphatidylglycerophosphatase A
MTKLLKDPGHFLMLGGGLGLIPFAPGTWGSLLGIALYFLFSRVDPVLYWLGVTLCFCAGVPLATRTGQALGATDHPSIVWDEVVGVLVALGLIGLNYRGCALAFLAFRALDIAKPGPIGWLDRHVKGGLGVMTDDLAAGLVAGLAVRLFYYIS